VLALCQIGVSHLSFKLADHTFFQLMRQVGCFVNFDDEGVLPAYCFRHYFLAVAVAGELIGFVLIDPFVPVVSSSGGEKMFYYAVYD